MSKSTYLGGNKVLLKKFNESLKKSGKQKLAAALALAKRLPNLLVKKENVELKK